MEKVWLLWHTHPGCEDDENAKLIGVYACEADALSAQERVKEMPGFVNWPDGFLAEAYEIGKDHWEEGFFTWPESLAAEGAPVPRFWEPGKARSVRKPK